MEPNYNVICNDNNRDVTDTGINMLKSILESTTATREDNSYII